MRGEAGQTGSSGDDLHGFGPRPDTDRLTTVTPGLGQKQRATLPTQPLSVQQIGHVELTGSEGVGNDPTSTAFGGFRPERNQPSGGVHIARLQRTDLFPA